MNDIASITNDQPWNEAIEQVVLHKPTRRTMVGESHQCFFPIYFSEQVKYDSAGFHRELFEVTEDDTISLAVVVAFRGSAKSTIITKSYPIWAILGRQQKKFVLIVAQTQEQARLYLNNIKQELERNALLKDDLGPFEEPNDEWRTSSIVIPRYGARITVASVDQTIRGIQHWGHRPDLIICDDIENAESARTKEARDKTHRWFTGELVPVGDLNTKIIVVGNLVHEDCLIMRLKAKIEEEPTTSIFKRYPVLDENGRSMWPGKYPTLESIEAQRRKVGDDIAWHREFLLEIIPEEDQVIKPEWIQRYDECPDRSDSGYRFTWSGVDVAISEKKTADYFAVVSAQVYGTKENMKVYILPHPINAHLSFPQQVESIRSLSTALGGGPPTKVFIEGTAYQDALAQQLRHVGFPVEGVKVQGSKQERLALTGYWIKAGKILFPKTGCEDLINQLTRFGAEKHDDLADAFSLLINKVIEESSKKPSFQGFMAFNDRGRLTRELFFD